jgi:chemotaxis protein MotB
MSENRPIIIIKKKAGHGGHHGGAWKVAYADFVTAMMALFIVLWLLNTNKKIQEAIGGYFKDPTGQSKMIGTSMQGTGRSFELSKDDMPKLREELQKTVRQLADFDKLKDHVEMTVTAEGLRIELTESEVGTFFESGSPTPSPSGRELLIAMAKELGGLPNKLSIEGHTDSRPFSGKRNYGNWELSVDRANAARRLMQENGVAANQVLQVRGYADQQLRKADSPDDPSNRRITLIVQYLESKRSPADEAKEAPPSPEKEEPGEKPKDPGSSD